MINLKKFFYVFASILIAAILGFFALSYVGLLPSFFDSNDKAVQKPKPKEPTTVKIAAFGDTMLHGPQIKGGMTPDGEYNFDHFFREVKPYLESADLAIGNLETTLAGKEKGYKGYPRFNAPDQIVDALLNSGVDLMSTANNHSMDTGEEGVKRTYEVLTQKGLLPVGTAPSAEKRKPTIVKKNGLTIAFLAYTEHTNGLPIPQGKEYLVNTIDSQQIAEDIKESKALGAEFVVVSLHFGMEYQRTPNEQQKKVAHQALQDGADVILGSHPHVIQPIEKLNVQGKEKLIIYSMGNFISNQFFPYTDEGLILFFEIEKNPETKQVKLKNSSFLPTFVHKYNKGAKPKYVVIPVTESEPNNLPAYPNISPNKWRKAWTNTVTLIKEKEAIPTFSLQNAQ